MPYYIWNAGRPAHQQQLENWVMNKGWGYASLTVLQAGGTLKPHLHHSENTHWIISGSIQFRYNIDGVHYFAEIPEIEPGSPDTARVEFPMAANVRYRATAGPKGCTFVEAHSVLSPDTAGRFASQARKTLVEVSEGTDKSFPSHEPQSPGSPESPLPRQAAQAEVMVAQAPAGKRR